LKAAKEQVRAHRLFAKKEAKAVEDLMVGFGPNR
jgi:hypothetical protein